MYKQAMVIGKFYPPHAGHHHLITTAAAQAERVAVLVLGNRFESISVEDRRAWLAEEFQEVKGVEIIGMPNDCPDDYHSDEIWKAQAELMRLALKSHGISSVDALFSSEEYGARLAGIFDAEHVLVDLSRSAYPVSGTLCREDLGAAWSWIIPSARQDMATRIIVVGAESTGTTTLAKALTGHYRQQFPRLLDVPEFGREYTYLKFDELRARTPGAGLQDMVWTAQDFGVVGARQTVLENAAADACPLVIADTDALATTLWERFYLGEGSFGSYHAADVLPRRDLYLITDHEGVEFEDDGWREGEHRRAEMTEWFKETLTEEGHSWILVTGDHDRRMKTAVEIIDLVLAQRSSLASPPWAARTVLEGAAA
ncbi:NadR type nicotinamide-nucleotide adenylyltransferase [Paenarthrobacter nicotinovorans]|uniref:AAA family ATPase n=1 Tax=Micrococcaceae TaxID=1268 RepID=UPI0008760CF7|nr:MULTISPECIES: AAA family ATPase [Micrococcaceae]MDR6436819.1 NadR type nicotinamide-nucleotide adenylyltransferase [Paenarthrobacter nicotinovorans]SCZ66289.1 nicotinamide-nucleotide adenylyltransferase, NadR type [Arthrobacter sp. UNCCL28]